MSEIDIRKVGRAGRITLMRPGALNAVTLPMIRAIGAALATWRDDDDVKMIVIDAAGEKAFSAGGDIADIYGALTRDDFDAARRFWREEYPVNAALFHFPKPIASFMQGFTMGGGVGVGCHASHRVVGEGSRIAMPECGIGLVPDVGGSLLLARAPGHLGEFLGTTAYRMGPGDAVFAGFADHFVPEADWPGLIARLEESGDANLILDARETPPGGALAGDQAKIDAYFRGPEFRDIISALSRSDEAWAAGTMQRLRANAPLAMAATVELVRRARRSDRIEDALANEYRFAHRVAAQGDFREGIRAAIIDKDKSPKWAHDRLDGPTPDEVAAMLAPLGDLELSLEDET